MGDHDTTQNRISKDKLLGLLLTSEVQLLRYNEPAPGYFVAESAKVIQRALDAGYEPLGILIDPESTGETERLLADEIGRRATVLEADRTVIERIRGYEMTRGLMCLMKRKTMADPGEMLSRCTRLAILENVENPTNVGAIFRSAAALGMDGLLLTGDCANPLYRRCARVSMGGVFQIPWVMTGKGTDYMKLLKEAGFLTAAMALRRDSSSIRDERLHQPGQKTAVILGNEGDGLLPETIERSDLTVMIPMAAGVDSLNVSMAATLAFWELGKCETQ